MREKMNILYITEYFPPYTKGGAEISTSLLVREISKDHNCYIITGDFQKDNWYDSNTEIYPLLKRTNIINPSIKGAFIYFFDYRIKVKKNFKIIKKLISDKKINLVHIIPTGPYSMGFVRDLLNLEIPLVIDNRGGILACPIAFNNPCNSNYKISFKCISCIAKNYKANFGVLNFIKKLFAFYELVNFYFNKKKIIYKININKRVILIPNSKFVKKLLVRGGYPKDKIKVIYNPRPINEIIKEHSAENKIIFAGAIKKEKGIWDAIKAFEFLNNKDLIFEIAGEGLELSKIKDYINKNKIKNITLLGKISNEEVLRLYSKSKIIIAPSIVPEAFSRCILESISTKTPLITTNVGGNSEGIKDHQTGLLIKPNNYRQLAKAIKELLTNKKLYNKIVKNLEKEADKYNPKTIGEQRMKVYEELIVK